MTKIAFVLNYGLMEPFGVLYLCGMLKKHKYHYEIILLSKNYLKEVKEYKPDIVAYNTIIGTQNKLLKANLEIKKILPNVFSIFGGHYPTLVQDMIYEEGVDSICVGEGDYAIIDLVKAFNQGEDYTKIKNLHFKQNGEIIRNSMRPLIDDLDSLPFPDRDMIYRKNKIFKDLVFRRFLTKRGCPFNCSYCFNEKLRDLYKGLGKYFRTRSVDNVIDEVEYVIREYPCPTVYFNDDTFTMNNRGWISEFSEQYSKRIGIPFGCITRVGTFDYSMMKALKKAGLYHLFIGVETATDEIRREVLARHHSNEQIREACRILRELRIKFRTLKSINTMKFNQELKPYYSVASIFQPYPGTSIAEYTKEHGYLPEDFKPSKSPSLFSSTKLSFGNEKEGKQIVTLQRIFSLCVKFPVISRFAHLLIKIPDNPLLVFINNLSRGLASYGIYKKWMTLRRVYYHVKFYFKAKEFF
jgi:radical SAM superfamily enzyme YgiQ (UPF0313 family)